MFIFVINQSRMKEILFFTTIFLIVAVICWFWVNGIDNMKEKHPDYKGEDFLNEENKEDENNIY